MAGIGHASATASYASPTAGATDPVTQGIGEATARAHAIQQLAKEFNVPAEPVAAAVNKISAGVHSHPPDADEIEAGKDELVTALTSPAGSNLTTPDACSDCNDAECSDSNAGASSVSATSGGKGAAGGAAAASDGAGTTGATAGAGDAAGAGGVGGTNYDALVAGQPPGQAMSRSALVAGTRQALIAAGMDPAVIDRVMAAVEQWLNSDAASTNPLDTTAPVTAAGSPTGADGGGNGGNGGNGGSGSGGGGGSSGAGAPATDSQGATGWDSGAGGLPSQTTGAPALRVAGGPAPTAQPAGPAPTVASLDAAAAGYGKTWTARPMTTAEIDAFGKEHAGEPATQANIEKWATEISGKTGIPVALLIADMANESSGNANAVGDVGAENGNSLGLFQIRQNFMDNNGWSHVFPFKMDSQTYQSNPAYQVAAGGSVLAFRMQSTGGVKEAFAQHLTGSTDQSPARVQEYLANLDKHAKTYNSGGDALTAVS